MYGLNFSFREERELDAQNQRSKCMVLRSFREERELDAQNQRSKCMVLRSFREERELDAQNQRSKCMVLRSFREERELGAQNQRSKCMVLRSFREERELEALFCLIFHLFTQIVSSEIRSHGKNEVIFFFVLVFLFRLGKGVSQNLD